MKRIMLSVLTMAALAAGLAGAGTAGASRAPRPPERGVVCAVPLRHGSVCIGTEGRQVLAGFYLNDASHKVTIIHPRGRFLRHQVFEFQFQSLRVKGIAGNPCLGSDPADPHGHLVPCFGRHATGAVFVSTGDIIISRYWSVIKNEPGHAGVLPWLLTSSRRFASLRFRAAGTTAASQRWHACSFGVCGVPTIPAVLTAAHHHDPIFGVNPDCEWPVIYISKIHIHGPHPRVIIVWRGHLVCHDRPTRLSSFMTLQKWSPTNKKWELLHVTKTHNGVRLIAPDLWTRNIDGPSHGCVIARLRANWNSHGLSSSGDPDEGSFCSPVLKVTGCGSHGDDVHKHGSIKRGCPNPLLQ